jgi:hypothetical protein
MGFLDSLFQPGDITEQGQVKSQTNFPQWYNRLNQANLLRATETAFEPIQAYQGPRQALSGKNQRDARQGISDISGIAAPSFAEAMNQSRLGATQLAGTDMRPYMSPYQQGVTDIALREARKQGDIQRNKLNSQATLSGAFGGSRAALEQMESERNIQQNLGDIQATGSQRAFESAIAQLIGDRAAASQAAPQMGALGTGLQGVLTSGLKESELAGERERSERQGALDTAYQDFLTQRQYPMAQASGLQSLLTGASVPGSSLQTTFGQPPSTGGQVGGLLMTGLGAYLGAGGAGLGAKDGGEIGVRRYKHGFEVEELDQDRQALLRQQQEEMWPSDEDEDGSDTGSSWLRTQLETGAGDPENFITQLWDAFSGDMPGSTFLADIDARQAAAERASMIDTGGPRFDPDVAQRFPSASEEIPEVASDTAPDTDPDPADTESGKGFDYDLLLELGLGMMAAGAVPGSTVAGSLGQGGLSALQNRRDADALRREEDLENRKLEAMIRGDDLRYAADISARDRGLLEDQLRTVDNDIKYTTDLLESILTEPMQDGVSVTGQTKDELEDMLIRLQMKKSDLRGQLGFNNTGVLIPENAAAD